ncbi:MAG: TolC family outer membrane protein [Gammaproteobacteria bacterium]|nr:TolC family outer membrane protein [Gammaproteobacteria bacterium]
MKSKLVTLCICAGLALPGVAAANSLLEIYQEALSRDATLASAEHARDAAVEARPQAWAALLPHVTFSGNEQRQVSKFFSTTSRFLLGGFTTYATNRGYTASLTQQIWSFQDFWQLKESAVQVASAENTYENAAQSLVLRVAQAYFNVLAAQDTVRADVAARDAFASQLEQAKKQFSVGLSAITDVQTAQASYDTSVATLIKDRQALANQRQALAVITGNYRAQIAPLADDIPLAPPDPPNADQWVAAAEKDNLDLRAAQLNYDIAERDVSVQRSARLPSLQLQSSVGRSISGGQSGANVRQWAAGVVLDFPVFQGGLVTSNVRRAVATAAQRQSDLTGQKRTVEQQTRDAYEGVMSGIASVRAFKQAVNSNRTALKAAEVGLQVGTRNVVDVLTAQQNLNTALKNYYQSRYDYLISVLTLEQQAGRLTRNDLAAIDAMLANTVGTPPPPEIPTTPQTNLPQPAAAGTSPPSSQAG